jgi:large subunit ribosomal protein L25
VTDQGGVLEHGMRTANVLCLPTAIPEAFSLDVSELMIGDNLRLRNLIEKYPDVQFLDDPDLPLATITPPKIEAEAAPKEAEPEVAEPELVKKEKEKEPEEETEKS